MTEVERFNDSSGAWEPIKYGSFEIEFGVSDLLIAPEATVTAPRTSPVSSGERLRIREDGGTTFEGRVQRTKPRVQGPMRIEAEHDAHALFDDTVTLDVTGTDEDVLQAALSDADPGAWTLTYVGTPTTLGDDYAVEGRSVKRVFRDMVDRVGRVWWVGVDHTITVAEYGAGGQLAAVDTAADDASVTEYIPDDIETVLNDVTVVGTGGEKVTGSASDSGSISEYGRQPERLNVSYIESASEADAYASEVLNPQPDAAATIRVGASVADVASPVVNQTLDVTDTQGTGMDEELVIEKQTVAQGSAELALGEGAGTNVEKFNRREKSKEDKFEGDNLDKIGGNLDDVEDGSDFGKILQSAIDNGRHTLSAAVGDLDNIQDGGTFARVRSGNVDEDNFVLLATSVGDLDDIDDGSQYGRVLTTGIDAGNIVLAEAVGNLDDIEDGSSFGKVAITNLTPGGAVFATGVELDDNRDLGSITTTDAAKSRTVIDGGEILTGSLTADEVDTLDLETGQITITGTDVNTSLIFEEDSLSDDYFIYPDGGADLRIGKDTDPVDNIVTFQAAPPSDNTGQIGTPSQAYTGVTAYNFNDAATGQPINDGGDPLSGLSDGDGPPEYAEQTDADGETTGYSINKMARGVWDVVRAQQRVIEDLEARIDDLEGGPNA